MMPSVTSRRAARAAIIAAGLGERLQQGGIAQPKPLVPVGGRALIDHVLGGVAAAGIDEVACIVNEIQHGVEEHCRRVWPGLRLEFVRRTTPSSMESLFALAPLLGREPFLLLTVDSIVAPSALSGFLDAAAGIPDAAGALALTRFVEDEKPLWAKPDPDGRLIALGPEASDSGHVTAGFYCFDPVIFAEIDTARERRFTAFRHFLGHLLDQGYPLYGVPVAKTVDVDRPEDISIAEAFLAAGYRE